MNGRIIVLIWAAALVTVVNYSSAQGTAFTYQAQLTDNGAPANGFFDITFTLYDSSGGPTVLGGPLTNSPTAVSNGLFTVLLDFGGGVFDGSDRWLEIGVVTNGGGALEILVPRQFITATPYAVRALTVDSGALAGPFNETVSFSNPANTFTGGFAGDGLLLSNVNAVTVGGHAASHFWQLDGNTGTSAGTNFLGTTDNVPLELRVNNQRVFQFLTTRSNEVYNLLGGSPYNYIAPDVISATLSGGGINDWLGDSRTNSLASDFATIGGGAGNTIQNNSSSTVISGGFENTIQEDSYAATIAGGTGNSIGTNSWQSFIAGGDNNHILDNTSLGTISGGSGHIIRDVSWRSTIGGGYVNEIGESSQGALIGGGTENLIGTNSDYSVVGGGAVNAISNDASFSVIAGGLFGSISSNSWYTVISGGRDNSVGGNAYYATIGGGYENVIQLSAESSTIAGGRLNLISTNSIDSVISGGQHNVIGADSRYSTIGGGRNNRVDGDYSFAAGQRAKALHDGAFVWADTVGFDFQSLVANQFAVRATGGVRFETGGSGLTVDGLPVLSGPVGTPLIADGSVTTVKLADGSVAAAKLGDGSVISSKIAAGAVSGLGTPDGSDPTVVTVDNAGAINLETIHLSTGSGTAATGDNSTAMGSDTVASGFYSTAMGRRAKATHDGSFVWADGQDADFTSTADDEFSVRAAGGLRIVNQGDGALLLHLATDRPWGFRQLGAGSTSALELYNFSINKNFIINTTGNVGIGTPAPAFTLHVNGSAGKPGGGSWSTASDARLKDVGPRFTRGLEALEAIQPRRYHYSADNALDLPSEPDYVGLIAQEVQTCIPEAVERNATGYLHLNNDPILWTMLNGIKELNQKLEQELQRRDGENVALKARLERLEQLLNQKLNGGAK